MKNQRKGWSIFKTDPALILACICTGAYYFVLFQPSMRESMLAKYTSEHAVEYVIVGLFFWGMIDIVIKLLSFPREFFAARHQWLPARVGQEPATNAPALLAQIKSNPAWMLSSSVGRRLVESLSFVVEKGSSQGFREHLEHLAERDDQELHAKYTVLRFVIAVTPILGFLGTVVHFGAAIGSFSFEDMDAKLPEIVAGMGTAFNTTSVALATAMTMMFALFLCERVDRGITAMIDGFLDRELMHRFESKDADVVPFLATLQSANREAQAAISEMVKGQVQIWIKCLDTLFAHFEERQREAMAHEQATFEALRQRHAEIEVAREDRLLQMISSVEARQDVHLGQIQAGLDRALAFREDIGQLVEALGSIARGEGQLLTLQTSLSDNLRVLHESSQFDSALHELTAAIHLMTSRARQIGHGDSIAA